MNPLHILALLFGTVVPPAFGDSMDWIDPFWVVHHSSAQAIPAQQWITAAAGTSGRKGPWSVTNTTVMPPSGNRHDYLSWAPYHWPNCNWCPAKSGMDRREFPDLYMPPLASERQPIFWDPPPNDPSRDDLFDANDLPAWLSPIVGSDQDTPLQSPLPESPLDIAPPNDGGDSLTASPALSIPVLSDRPLTVPTSSTLASETGMAAPTSMSESSTTATATSDTVSGTLRPAKNPVKTTSSSSHCTPSPTRSMAPSATWTTCPYVTKDGQRNTDVDLPGDSSSMVSMAQAVLYNSLAAILNTSPSTYSKTAASILNAWFVDRQTGMNPHVQYGQVVRGPGIQTGSFMGVLDLRGMIQVLNGVQVLKLANASTWTPCLESQMQIWVAKYDNWMTSSDTGRKAGDAANNHGTFWMSQMGALKSYRNDIEGLRDVMQYYFTHQFLDQIAASGEQPFEAVRTRPFHYRGFNLEAMIVNAKLAEQAGLNMWIARSRYGATIQTATDFLMGVDPKDEDSSELLPHIASVIAAYGDPTGKYRTFIEKSDPMYQSRSWWFYNQPGSVRGARSTPSGSASRPQRKKRGDARVSGTSLFVKPAAFSRNDTIQLDDGVYVTWEDLLPYYMPESLPSQ